MQSSSSSSPSSASTTTATKSPAHHHHLGTKLMQPSKTTGLKTKTPTSHTLNAAVPTAALNNGTAVGRDLQTTREIEEISKKISEHADALYRTWKSHGIAPTEILDIYTAEAAAATGSITDDVKSTEGLQKLVNSFVIKDKEQRGVKTSKSGGGSKSTGAAKTEVKVPATATASQQKKARSPSPTQSPQSPVNTNLKGTISNKSTPFSSTATTTTKTSTPAFLLNHKTSRLGEMGGDVVDAPSLKPTTGTTKLKTMKQSGGGTINEAAKLSKNPTTKALDLNFDINLDLNLDVHALTLQQTENLQKIKELLQQESTPGGGGGGSGGKSGSLPSSTKIPSVIIEKSSANKLKEGKVKKAATGESGKKSVTAEDHKHNDETKVVHRKPTTTTTTTSATGAASVTPQSIKKIGNKTKSPSGSVSVPTDAGPLLNALDTLDNRSQMINQTAIVSVTDKSNRKSDKDRDGNSPGNIKKRTTNVNGGPCSTSVTTTTNSTPNRSCSPISNGGVGVVIALDTISDSVLKTKSYKSKTAEDSPKLNVQQNVESLDAAVKSQKSPTKTGKTTKSVKEKNKDSSSSSANSPRSIADSDTKDSSPKSPASSGPTSPSSSPSPSPSPSSESSPPHTMEVARSNGSSMLTPTKLKSTRPLTNGQEKTLRSPFLTRGSVAERVLMFEKCPDVRNSFLNIKRPDRADAPPKSLLKAKLHATPPPPPPDHTSLQREIRNTKSVYIPRFYFPHGKPQPTIALERTLRGILSAFDTFPNNQVTRDELPRILKICGLPFYWRMPVMVFCQQSNSGLVERQRFVEFWKQMNVYCHDEASRFVYILSRGQRMRSYILPEDLAPLVQDVVDTHPGLAFLKEATEFHSRYVHTVIARIFYNVNRCWSGKISISELKKSDLLEIITLLEEEDDINQIMAFFSYEHFYVIYCKFWELDKDHDLLINQDDLARHSDHALSTRIVERIFSGCVTRSDNKKKPDDEPKMSYTDFVWFLLSEEDKRTPTAIEYWFRCMDIDGDGLLSMYELEYFYEEQQQRMESIGIESLPFEDCLCQMLDMIKPRNRDAITLSDLKNCKMTHVFFDTFFNLEKYLDHEQRDPFASQRDDYTSDWDRFAAQEYELLITEEND